MKIEIKNCNSIDYANISIKENTLNIKYGINGTGKTTISKAIQYATRDDRDELFNILIPFKHRKIKLKIIFLKLVELIILKQYYFLMKNMLIILYFLKMKY